MIDLEQIQEYKYRLAERYTAEELVEILGIPVEDIIDEYWEYLLQFKPEILNEVGLANDEDEEE